jgi:putative NIF3 family GTP cyclohydrolase 1 type 2
VDLGILVAQLDHELGIPAHHENLVEWAVTDDNKRYVCQEFLDRKTGLMLKSSTEVHEAYTTVFISDKAIEKLSSQRDCLLFTHHHFNYHEDSRGLTAIEPEVLQYLHDRGISIYVAHAPLDTHPQLGTSIALAKLIGVSVESYFYDYFGAPTAICGHVLKTDLKVLSESVKYKLCRPTITLVEYRPFVEKVAVVAGGGDLPDLLQIASDLGCDTLLTGTVENRWLVPFIQDANRDFHKLNERLKLNLIGGTHFGTERPAMIQATKLFGTLNLRSEYLEDEDLLSSQ